MTRQSAMRKADKAMSRFVRTRDSQKWQCKQFRCISCGRILPIEQADAGHYVNRCHMGLRYNEQNVNAQCRKCNRFDEGNATGYRQGLVAKIGIQRVELLEALKNSTHKLTAAELEIIAEHFKRQTLQFPFQL